MLLRNAVLTGLQDLESEAGYLARCAQAKYASSGPPSPLSDGIVCLADMSDDEAEMIGLLASTLESFEKLFSAVSPAEMRQAQAESQRRSGQASVETGAVQ